MKRITAECMGSWKWQNAYRITTSEIIEPEVYERGFDEFDNGWCGHAV